MQTPSVAQPAPEAKPETKPEPQVAAVAPPQEQPIVEKAEPPPIDTPPVPETPPVLTEVVLPPPRPPHKTAEPRDQKHRRKLADLNIGFKDLETSKSSLEDIFVDLVKEGGK